MLKFRTGIAQDSGLKKNINIEKESSVQIETARRIFDKMEAAPSTQELSAKDTLSRYRFSLIHYPLNAIDPAVNLAERQLTTRPSAEANYLKAGLGNYITSYLEGFLGSQPNKDYQLGLHVKHLASQRGAVDKQNSASSWNEAEFIGRYFMPKGEMLGSLSYERQMIKYYGYGKNAPRNIIDTFQVPKNIYQTVASRVSFKSAEKKSHPITYQADLRFHRISDAFNAQENNLDLSGKLYFRMNAQQRISIRTNLIIANQSDSMQLNRNMFRFAPAYHHQKESLELSGGIIIAYQAKTFETNVNPQDYKSNFYVYPHLFAKAQILPHELSVFGSITGDLIQQTWRGFIAENPFLNRNIAMAHTHNPLTLQIGTEISPNNQLNIKGTANYGLYKNMHFFINHFADSAFFDIAYQNKTVGMFTASGELAYDLSNYKTIATAEYFHYNMPKDSVLTYPFHRPQYKISWLNSAAVYENIRTEISLFLLGGILAPKYEMNRVVSARELPVIADMNLKGEYRIKENVFIFLVINNLFSRRYERYQYYYVRGINGLIGASISF